MPERAKVQQIDTDMTASEFQTEWVLTLKAFAENADAIHGTDSNSLSDDRNVLNLHN